MNYWLIFIIGILVFTFVLEFIVSKLNLSALSPQLPEEFKDIFDQSKYRQTQNYTRVITRFSLIQSSFSTILTILFILLGGFNFLDIFARSFGFSQIITGLIYTGSLLFLTMVIGLPFSLYSTFVIEERFGFNRTTAKTFILDIVKSIALTILLGGPILALVLWFFESTGQYGWLFCWIGVFTISLIFQYLAPIFIMPLFNKFTPLENGDLKDSIFDYAEKENFKLQTICVMDGSKRSSKLNAFFTGFGRYKKIVFFDTLMEKLTSAQILGVLAHEMGHYKKKHLLKLLVASFFQTGLIFYFLSLIMNNNLLFAAFKMEYVSIYASLIFFGFLYTPVNLILSIVFNHVSRKHEYEADSYAAQSTGKPSDLIDGLKILSKENLANLTPHPLHVFLHYSHPPILTRIQTLRNIDLADRQK